MNPNLNQTVTAWLNLSNNLFVPHTETDYQKLVALTKNAQAFTVYYYIS